MEYKSFSIEDTYDLAKLVADRCVGNEIILLSGDLGSGKTTFTKGFAKALGVEKNVTSPTFTLMKTYMGGRLPLYHFDLYRVKTESEVEELGLSEYFDMGGICVIEWNKFEHLSGKIIKINFKYETNGERTITVEENQ